MENIKNPEKGKKRKAAPVLKASLAKNLLPVPMMNQNTCHADIVFIL
jgi:hypothetical protein